MIKYKNKIYFLWISLITLVGFFIISFSFIRTDYEQRSIRLQETLSIAQSTNFDELTSLTGTNTDLNKNYYQRLKNELTSICAQNSSYRFVYLLARKDDGTIFFFMDSEPVSSDDYSPPGQIFSEASNGIKNAFKTNQEFVEGPITDRWGTWITALVPIYNQETGEVMAMFGIDSKANLWYWSIIIKIIPIIILTFLIIIGSIIFIFANKNPNLSSKPVLNQLMPPLIFLISLVIISSLFLFLQQQKKTTLSNLSREHAEIISDMHILLNEQAKALQSIERSLVTDSTMRKSLRNRDSASLLAQYKGLFDTIHKENKVTHFYFFDANRICLLRIHKPEKYGDKINRATAITAEQTRKTAFGIELGPLGTFTLRVVMPVFDGQTLIGYIELGKEIEDVLELIHKQTDFELAVAIDKKLLDQKAWEDGMQLMNRTPDWDRLKYSVISYCSMTLLPDTFAEKADHNPTNGHHHGNYNQNISFNKNPWHLSISTLIDYSGNDVGGLIIFSDISKEQESFYHAMLLAGASAFLLLITLFGFIFSLLRRTDRSIIEQQEKLYENNIRYDQLAEQSKTFNWEMDSTGLFTYVSHTVEKVIGYSPEELIGKMHFYDLHPEEEREIFNEPVKNLQHLELSKNGEALWVSTNGFPVIDNHNNVIGFRGNTTNINQRILAEIALYKSNEQLSATLLSIGDGVITCDNLGNIVLLNTVAEELTGWKTSEATGLPIEDIFNLVQSETGERAINPVRESLKNNIIIEISSHTLLLSKDNYKYQISNTCSPIRDSSGSLLGAVLVFRNVTEKYIQEAELEKYAEKLEESNQELSAFASIASHDLKAPLRGISNCATFLKIDHPDLAQPVKEKINYIIELTENLNNLIDDLLSFSKLGSTGLTFNKYHLNDIVKEALENIKACDFFANAEINIKNLPDEELLCNKERLKYVYQNLIANGLKYNNKEHKYIEIGYFDENKQRIYYVYDNGIGIEEKYHEDVFQIFKRLHGKNEYSGGTGVGLAIVKKVIMQHNGTVWIKSKINEGTTFYFTINA